MLGFDKYPTLFRLSSFRVCEYQLCSEFESRPVLTPKFVIFLFVFYRTCPNGKVLLENSKPLIFALIPVMPALSLFHLVATNVLWFL